MKKHFIVLVLASLMVSAAFAGYEEGMAAFRKGNYAAALKELRPLAEQGHVRAQNNLGNMYSKGLGVPKNNKTAIKWLRLSADQGHVRAQYNLGVVYSQEGPENDVKEAIKWYRLAADQGHISAQYNLGVMYSQEGSENDDKEAIKWYRLAVEHGHIKAPNNLGQMYEGGQGVQQDRIVAYALFSISSALDEDEDDVSPENLDAIAKEMSPTEIEIAKALAVEMSKQGNLLKALDAYLETRK